MVQRLNRASSLLAEQASESIEQTDPATDCGSTSTGEGEESPPAPDSMDIPERTRRFLNDLLSSEGVRFDESVERYWQELAESGEIPSEIVAEMRRDRRLYEDEFVSLHADFLERIGDAPWRKSLKLAKHSENATRFLESYELLLGYTKNLIIGQVSEMLVSLPSRRRDNILSSLGCKLAARILILTHTAKTNHLDGKPPFALSSRVHPIPAPIPNRDQKRGVASAGEKNREPDCVQTERPNYPRKGHSTILSGKSAVNFSIAEQYLGITDRRRQQLLKEGVLQRAGKGRNTLITVSSLLAFLPPSK